MPNLSYNLAGAGAVAADSVSIGGVDSADYVRALVDASKDLLLPAHDSASGSAVSIAGRAYARYCGKRSKLVTSVDAHLYRAAAAAAGTGWAELAIATGELENVSGILATTLTVVGFASIDTEVKAGGLSVIQKAIGSLTIPANTGIWVIVAGSYDATQASYRTVEEVMGLRVRDATRPSLNIGTPLAFVGATTATINPWLKAFIA